MPLAARSQTPAQKAAPAPRAGETAESPAPYQAARYISGNRLDPFLNPLLLKKTAVNEEAPRGTPPPGIAGMYINQVELLGMSLSPEGKTGVFRGTDKRVYFMHEGDRLFDGFIKTITLESVQLTRETKLRSGKVLTQEVIKRLRNQ